MRKPPVRGWTEKEEFILHEMRREGVPYKLIALQLGRTYEACETKYRSVDWDKFYADRKSRDSLDAKCISEAKEAIAKSFDRKANLLKVNADIISDRLAKVISPYKNIDPPSYKPKVSVNKKHQAEDVVLILSDIHIGAHHTLEETGGLSEFNETVLRNRMLNLMRAVRDIYVLHSSLYEIPTLHIACLGDIVAGDNSSGEWSQNSLNMTILDQVGRGYQLLSEMISYWLTIFPKIKFHGVRGNHGRVSSRGIEKDYVNWDNVCYEFLKLSFVNNPRIQFNVPKTWWILEEIRNHKFLMVHGDDTKSKGTPIRGLLDFEQKMVGIIKKIPDYTLAGHFHNSSELTTNNGRVIINGSVIGGDVYSIKTVHASSKPEQTVFGVHPRHGITWKYNINLEYPRDPD